MSTIALENDVRSFAARYAQPNISGFWEAAVHKDARSAENLGLATSALRSVKLFARFGEGQIRSFLRYLEEVQVPQFGHLVRKGQRGDAMYVVLEGELRALTIVEGKETTLATIGAGDCFGEVSLLDQGPSSADVIANRDSRLLRLSRAAFERLILEAPDFAVPLLLALSRGVVDLIRRSTKRNEELIRFIRTSLAARQSDVLAADPEKNPQSDQRIGVSSRLSLSTNRPDQIPWPA